MAIEQTIKKTSTKLVETTPKAKVVKPTKVVKKEIKVEKKIKSVETAKEVSTKVEFAVIEVSGNQYLVEVGKEYIIKKIDTEKGNKFVCENVLLLSSGDKVLVGKPYLKDVKVECEVSSQKKGEKVNTFRYTAKSRFRKRVGSRALLTRILIKKFVTAAK